jgi:hypothetical protein
MSENQQESETFKKYLIAGLVGVGTLAGFGLLYSYFNQETETKKIEKKTETTQEVKPEKETSLVTISTENKKEEEEAEAEDAEEDDDEDEDYEDEEEYEDDEGNDFMSSQEIDKLLRMGLKDDESQGQLAGIELMIKMLMVPQVETLIKFKQNVNHNFQFPF